MKSNKYEFVIYRDKYVKVCEDCGSLYQRESTAKKCCGYKLIKLFKVIDVTTKRDFDMISLDEMKESGLQFND